MSPSSCCELWRMPAVVELPRVQVAEILVGQDFGKPYDGIQWRPQLVRNVGDELAFQPPRRFERFVALAQNAFIPRRIGHIEIGHQHIAVRQGNRRLLQHRPVGSVDRAARRRLSGDF